MTYENLYSAAMDVIKTNNLQSTSRPNDSVCLILTSKDTIYTGVSYNTMTDGNPTEKSAERAALNNMLSGGEHTVSALITVSISSLQPLYPNKEVLGLIRTTNPENSKCMVCMPNKLYHPLTEAIGMIPEAAQQNVSVSSYTNGAQGMSDQQYMNKMNQYMNNIQQYQNNQYINNTQPYTNGQYMNQYQYQNQSYQNPYINGINQYQGYPYQQQYYPNNYQQQYPNYSANIIQNQNSKYFTDNKQNKQSNINVGYYQPNPAEQVYFHQYSTNQNYMPYNNQAYNGQNYYNQQYPVQGMNQPYQQQTPGVSVSMPYPPQNSVSMPYPTQDEASKINPTINESVQNDQPAEPEIQNEQAANDKDKTEQTQSSSTEAVTADTAPADNASANTSSDDRSDKTEQTANTSPAKAPEKIKPEMYGTTKALYPTPKSTIIQVKAETKEYDSKENENKLGSADAISGPFDPQIDYFFYDDAEPTESIEKSESKESTPDAKEPAVKEPKTDADSSNNTNTEAQPSAEPAEITVESNTEQTADAAETPQKEKTDAEPKSEDKINKPESKTDPEKSPSSNVTDTNESSTVLPEIKAESSTSDNTEKSNDNTIKKLDNPIFIQTDNKNHKKEHRNKFFQNLFK